MRQNKQMELAVVSVEQLHKEFEWMKEQLKKEILLDVEKLGSKATYKTTVSGLFKRIKTNYHQLV